MLKKQNINTLKELGENIKKKRITQKVTQAQLAFELGTDGRHIRRIEAGEVNPTFLTLKKIAEVLECKLTDLII